MNNWIVGTVLAATVIGGGGAIYMIAVPPPVPAVPAKAGSEASEAATAQGTQASGSPAEGPVKEITADAVRPGPASSSPSAQSIVALGPIPPTILRFRIEVSRSDKPNLNTTWTAICPRVAMTTMDGCQTVNDRRSANEAPSGIALVDEGDGRIGYLWNPSTNISPDAGESLQPGLNYPIHGRGGPKIRWAIPIEDWKAGVTFHLFDSWKKLMKKETVLIGEAKIKLID